MKEACMIHESGMGDLKVGNVPFKKRRLEMFHDKLEICIVSLFAYIILIQRLSLGQNFSHTHASLET
jgi:hypothetical protein